jgi:hypothetical protein
MNFANQSFSHWRRYRGEPEYDLQTWQASPHRTQAFTAADLQPMDQQSPLMLLRIPRTPRVPQMSIPFTKLLPEQQDFLNRRLIPRIL